MHTSSVGYIICSWYQFPEDNCPFIPLTFSTSDSRARAHVGFEADHGGGIGRGQCMARALDGGGIRFSDWHWAVVRVSKTLGDNHMSWPARRSLQKGPTGLQARRKRSKTFQGWEAHSRNVGFLDQRNRRRLVTLDRARGVRNRVLCTNPIPTRSEPNCLKSVRLADRTKAGMTCAWGLPAPRRLRLRSSEKAMKLVCIVSECSQ